MITAFFVFIIGACVGSFCSVLLHRLRFGGSVVSGRSQCINCKHKLAVRDLIPVVSWVLSAGRCRYCHVRFGWQYLALELGFGAMFLGAYYQYCCFGDLCPANGCLFSAGRLAIFLVFLALVFVYDARWSEIPDIFSLTGTAVALVINIFFSPAAWFWYLAAAAVGAGFFGIQYAVSRGKWVGDGDIMMGMMIGAMVGWPNIFPALLVSYVLGLVFVIALMLAKRKRLTDAIPLGPLLALGTAIVLFAPLPVLTNFIYAITFK